MSQQHPHDGGPAFPRAASEYTRNGTLPDGNDAIREQDGMSLRAWLAGQAMNGLLGQHWSDEQGVVFSPYHDLAVNSREKADRVARLAVIQADSMLAALGAPTPAECDGELLAAATDALPFMAEAAKANGADPDHHPVIRRLADAIEAGKGGGA